EVRRGRTRRRHGHTLEPGGRGLVGGDAHVDGEQKIATRLVEIHGYGAGSGIGREVLLLAPGALDGGKRGGEGDVGGQVLQVKVPSGAFQGEALQREHLRLRRRGGACEGEGGRWLPGEARTSRENGDNQL